MSESDSPVVEAEEAEMESEKGKLSKSVFMVVDV